MTFRCVPAVLACLAAWMCPAAAQVSKWVDAQGRVHYGDRPPASTGTRTLPLRGTVSVGEGVSLVPGIDTSGPGNKPSATTVVAPRPQETWIYTTPSCGYCKRAMKHMQQRNVTFTEKDVSTNARYKEEFLAIGGRGVPVTLSGNKRVNGYDKESFDAFLKSAGF